MFVLCYATFVGQIEVGQWHGIDCDSTGLSIGSIAGLLDDIALLKVHVQRANLGLLISPKVISTHVERAPVGIKAIAGQSLAVPTQ